MIRLYFALFFTLGIALFSAQQFSGLIILEDRSSMYLNQIFVTNLTSQKTILADPSGNFSISAKEGDILRFTSIITERKDIRTTAKHLENLHNVINLQVAYFDIGEVKLTAFKPSQNLKKDVLSLKTNNKTENIKKAVGLPEPKGDGLPPEIPAVAFANGGLSISIDTIYDILSGERKKKERLKRYEIMMTSIEKIKKYFGNQYFKSVGIPENMIENFLQFVYSSENIEPLLHQKNFEAVKIPMEKFLPIYKHRLKNSQILQLKLE